MDQTVAAEEIRSPASSLRRSKLDEFVVDGAMQERILMNYAPAEIYTELRSQSLGATAAALGVKNQTFGVIMETGYPEAVVTLVAICDGTASLYFSTGGGMIGLGDHEGPAVAARSLVAFADHNLELLEPAADTSLPRPGYTRFFVLTQRGTLTAEAKEEDLGENRHVLSPLFYPAQELISEMRDVEEPAE